MRTYGNEIQVTQGEDWNLDLQLKVGEHPYIVSNQRDNPFFVVTIASTKFEKNLRYVKSWWNRVSLPTFYQTTPIYIGEVSGEAYLTDSLRTRSDFTGEFGDLETSDTDRNLYYCIYSNEEVIEGTNHKPYHYFYYEGEGGSATVNIGYNCPLRQNFSTDVTKEWVSQNYLYQITLVDGPLLLVTLNTIALSNNNQELPEDWPIIKDEAGNELRTDEALKTAYNNNTLQLGWEKIEGAQYDYVKIQWPTALDSDIDKDSELGILNSPEVIMSPTKLEVFNNLRNLI